ncbi:MAG: hypothetical protein GTN78_20065, partial [Gemmatimonadales bacterium]|nr:hypothetical protein [Gemmatimonadales bacterium]
TGAGEYRCAETDTANNLAVDPSGNIHLTWMEDSTGNYEIHYRRKVGPTGPWEAAVQLTDDPGFSSAPSIAADSQGNLHLAWHDLRLDSLD